MKKKEPFHSFSTRKKELQVGEIVQLHPTKCINKMFAGCLLVVSEPKSFGAQGYVQALGANGGVGGQAYYRARWEEMEETGGMAPWIMDHREREAKT